MNVLNPYVRQFLVGWITVLDSVPDIDMLGFLPDFLDGKKTILFKVNRLLPQFSCSLSQTSMNLTDMMISHVYSIC